MSESVSQSVSQFVGEYTNLSGLTFQGSSHQIHLQLPCSLLIPSQTHHPPPSHAHAHSRDAGLTGCGFGTTGRGGTTGTTGTTGCGGATLAHCTENENETHARDIATL